MSERKVLVLRTCKADMTSHGGFTWPESGPVECPDWDATPECGNGLHGLLWGEGDGSLLWWDDTARWLVLEVDRECTVSLLGGKVKFPRAIVVFVGSRFDATSYLIAHGGQGRAVVGATVSGGYSATVSGGSHATVSGGSHAILMTKYHDGSCYRIAVAYVNEDGIVPDVPYHVVDGKLVPKEMPK